MYHGLYLITNHLLGDLVGEDTYTRFYHVSTPATAKLRSMENLLSMTNRGFWICGNQSELIGTILHMFYLE
jgi:hypothetical protein